MYGQGLKGKEKETLVLESVSGLRDEAVILEVDTAEMTLKIGLFP